MAKRLVVGTRGPHTFLVALSSPGTIETLGVVVAFGELQGGAAPIQSFLARGYWEDFEGTDAEAQTILKAVPAHPPIVVSLSATEFPDA